MITKLLVNWLKKNKVQLKTEAAGHRFFNAFCFESMLGICCAIVGLILATNKYTHIMIFGIIILIYGMCCTISFFPIGLVLKVFGNEKGSLPLNITQLEQF